MQLLQRVRLAAREDGGGTGPEELRADRDDDRGDADHRDQDAVDDTDERAAGERRQHTEPGTAELRFADREEEAGEGERRRERQVNLPGRDNEREADGEHQHGWHCGEKGEVDGPAEEDLWCRDHEEHDEDDEDENDRQPLEVGETRQQARRRCLGGKMCAHQPGPTACPLC